MKQSKKNCDNCMKEKQGCRRKKTNSHKKDRQKALRYLMFIKEKRDGTEKARGCAEGFTRAVHK